jgi:hypothetical protein
MTLFRSSLSSQRLIQINVARQFHRRFVGFPGACARVVDKPRYSGFSGEGRAPGALHMTFIKEVAGLWRNLD